MGRLSNDESGLYEFVGRYDNEGLCHKCGCKATHVYHDKTKLVKMRLCKVDYNTVYTSVKRGKLVTMKPVIRDDVTLLDGWIDGKKSMIFNPSPFVYKVVDKIMYREFMKIMASSEDFSKKLQNIEVLKQTQYYDSNGDVRCPSIEEINAFELSMGQV